MPNRTQDREPSSREWDWPEYTHEQRVQIAKAFRTVSHRSQLKKVYQCETAHLQTNTPTHIILWRIIKKQSCLYDEIYATFYVFITACLAALCPIFINLWIAWTGYVHYSLVSCAQVLDGSEHPFEFKMPLSFNQTCVQPLGLFQNLNEYNTSLVVNSESNVCIGYYSTFVEESQYSNRANVFLLATILSLCLFTYWIKERYRKLRALVISVYFQSTLVTAPPKWGILDQYGYVSLWFLAYYYFWASQEEGVIDYLVVNNNQYQCDDIKLPSVIPQQGMNYFARCAECNTITSIVLLRYSDNFKFTFSSYMAFFTICYAWYKVAWMNTKMYNFIEPDVHLFDSTLSESNWRDITKLRKRTMPIIRAYDYETYLMRKSILKAYPSLTSINSDDYSIDENTIEMHERETGRLLGAVTTNID